MNKFQREHFMPTMQEYGQTIVYEYHHQILLSGQMVYDSCVPILTKLFEQSTFKTIYDAMQKTKKVSDGGTGHPYEYEDKYMDRHFPLRQFVYSVIPYTAIKGELYKGARERFCDLRYNEFVSSGDIGKYSFTEREFRIMCRREFGKIFCEERVTDMITTLTDYYLCKLEGT